MTSTTLASTTHTQGAAAQTAVIPVDSYETQVEIEVSVFYAAMSATSGCTVSFQRSADGGATYSAINVFGPTTVKPSAAGVLALQSYFIKRVGNLAFTHIKVSVANTDTVNIASVGIRSELQK